MQRTLKGLGRGHRPMMQPQTWVGGPRLPPPMSRAEYLEHLVLVFGDADHRGVWSRASRYFAVGSRTLSRYGRDGACGNEPVPVQLNLALRALRAVLDDRA